MTGGGRRAAGTALAVVAGALFAVQARINGELGERLNDGVAAALFSFGSGLALLLAFTALSGRMRAGLRRVAAALRNRRLRWWHVAGGVSGGYVVACQGLTVAAIGVAVFTIALVGGQTASGLVVDRLGLGPAGPHPLTARRVTGAVMAVVAVLVTVSDRIGTVNTESTLALVVLPLLAGIGIAWQQAVIGQVGVAAGGAAPAALVNFAGGTAVLTAAAAVLAAVRGLPADWPDEPLLYAGGPLGVAYIASAVLVVRWTGVLLLGLGTVAGQVLGALLLDAFVPAVRYSPASPAADDSLSAATVAGAALALAAVVITAPTAVPRRGGSARMDR
ncbi:MAG TPA: DMT family transporter [Pseudonocardiaceae bacterium]|nr:DMT family transporter [Pseudonocardiaceae bacterium]